MTNEVLGKWDVQLIHKLIGCQIFKLLGGFLLLDWMRFALQNATALQHRIPTININQRFLNTVSQIPRSLNTKWHGVLTCRI